MAFLTDRKRAIGQGSAREGTHHFWSMTKSSAALLILVPLFVFTFGPILGAPYAEVVAYYRQPIPALIALIALTVALLHFKGGAQVLIEDYVHGLARKITIIAVTALTYALIAAAILAIIGLAV